MIWSDHNKKFAVYIPSEIIFLFHEKKNTLILKGPRGTYIFKPQVFIRPSNNKRTILISAKSTRDISNKDKKNLSSLQGTLTANLKRKITELLVEHCKRLKLIGVGYRILKVENFEGKILTFKLGYSHLIYVRVPFNLKSHCIKFTRLFMFSNCLRDLYQTSANIRDLRKPEPYKGKGVLYAEEKLTLKEGKKT